MLGVRTEIDESEPNSTIMNQNSEFRNGETKIKAWEWTCNFLKCGTKKKCGLQ